MITSDTTITTKIDWLSVTIEDIKYAPNWSKKRKEMKRGLLGYDTGVKYIDGRIELCHSTRKDMKPHVIFSGGCIDRICIENKQDSLSVARQMSKGFPSRIDIAVDVKNGTLPIEKLRDAIENNEAETRTTTALYMSGVGVDGETLYIGSQGSNKRVRVYDKAAEQGIEDGKWTRIEMQLRHYQAVRTFDFLLNSGQPYQSIPAIILDFINFPKVKEWVIAMGSDKISPPTLEKTASNRRKWILETAVKAIAKEMVESGDGFDFLTTVNHAIEIAYSNEKMKYKG